MRAPSWLTTLICVVCLSRVGPENLASAASGAQTLFGIKTSEQFDGSTLMRIVYQDGGRIFRYSPPGGWEIRPAERTQLTKGKFTATMVLTVRNEPVRLDRENGEAPPPRDSPDETAAKDMLLLKIAGQPVTRNTVEFEGANGRYLRSVVKSLGDDWRVELSLEGPAKEFAAIEKQLLESFCSIEIQTAQDSQRIAREKERQALTEIVEPKNAPANSTPSGRIRGKL